MAFAGSKPAQFPTPSQCVAAFGLACYTPSEIRTGYNVPASLDGSGQTIVIVDAYGSPTLQNDLAVFDAVFGLPTPNLNIIYPEGMPPAFDPNSGNQIGWAVETSLDVEWSHAIAPDATIDLLIVPTNSGYPLDNAVSYAVQNHLGNVISLSWGAPEAAIQGKGNNIQLLQADKNYQAAQAAGITVLASSGDNGASNGYAFANALFPASDPLVTAVGGTDLFLSDTGAYKSEYTWDDSIPAQCPFGCTQGIFGATGGAPSAIFAAPSYQQALSGQTARTTSDVGYNASVYTAVLVYMSFIPSGFYFVGGTSEGAPQWAGLVALADQSAGHALGFINPKLYAIGAKKSSYNSAFHDITIGSNAFVGPGFSAGPGYDLPTGLGTPDAANLIRALTSSK
jgi:subtilase family serine protease